MTPWMNYLRAGQCPCSAGGFHYVLFVFSLFDPCFLFVGLCEHPGSSGYVVQIFAYLVIEFID